MMHDTPDDLARFAHALGHEMLTPLSGLAMLLASMRAGDRTAAEFDARLMQAEQATQRLTRLVRAFVDYVDAGVASRPLAPVATDEVLAEAASGFERGLVTPVGDLPTVVADRAGLRRVFLALLDNAVRYAGEGPPQVTVQAEREGAGWRFEVRDRGVGIAPDLRARLFAPLVRGSAQDAPVGSGLGLATCARIVARHGGRIGVQARAGGGTVVYFTLPDRAEN